MNAHRDLGLRGAAARLLTGWAAAAIGFAPPTLAAEALSGEVSLGWREVRVSGDEAKYRQHVNLDDGPRLFDATLAWMSNGEPAAGLAPERITLELSDLGGDPYERSRLALARTGRYRFSYERLESEYFYDDILVLPENASVEGSTGGDFRRFDFERIRDQAELQVDLSERTAVNVGFDRYRKRGDSTTIMDIEREEFVLDRPVDETMESVALAVSHRWDRVTATLTERRRRFDYAASMFLPGASEGSNPEEPTALDFFFLDQPYELDSREHELRLQGRPAAGLNVSASVALAAVDVDLEAAERSQGLDFTGTPFERALRGGGDVDQDRELYGLGVDYALNGRVGLFTRLRVAALAQSGSSSFEADGSGDWDIDSQRLEVGTRIALSRDVHVALGWGGEWREVSTVQAVADTIQRDELDTDAGGGFARLTWRPSPQASLHLAVEDDSIDDPYTLSSPTDARRYQLRGRYRWDSGWHVSAAWVDSERRNDRSGWHADAERAEFRAGFAGQRLDVSAGLSRFELARSVDSLVVGGARQALFLIDYGAESDMVDMAASWRFGAGLTAGGSYRRYDNDGSFGVERDDLRVFVDGRIADGYRWGLEYRDVDFAEGGIENFDAEILELSVGLQW